MFCFFCVLFNGVAVFMLIEHTPATAMLGDNVHTYVSTVFLAEVGLENKLTVTSERSVMVVFKRDEGGGERREGEAG